MDEGHPIWKERPYSPRGNLPGVNWMSSTDKEPLAKGTENKDKAEETSFWA